jgi:hypothetical protein
MKNDSSELGGPELPHLVAFFITIEEHVDLIELLEHLQVVLSPDSSSRETDCGNAKFCECKAVKLALNESNSCVASVEIRNSIELRRRSAVCQILLVSSPTHVFTVMGPEASEAVADNSCRSEVRDRETSSVMLVVVIDHSQPCRSDCLLGEAPTLQVGPGAVQVPLPPHGVRLQ